MQEFGTCIKPLLGHRPRIVTEDGIASVVALLQPNTLAIQ